MYFRLLGEIFSLVLFFGICLPITLSLHHKQTQNNSEQKQHLSR